jgi:hypothetical protein
LDIDSTVFAILDQGERIVGSGFLVSAEYGVTCAHVIHDAGAIAGDVVHVRFFGQKDRVEAQVVLQFWSEPEEFDVAILKLERIPAGVRPLRLERASTCHVGGKLYTFGYARAADETHLSGHGEFTNFPTGSKVFQFRMHEVNHGHSGAPLLDLQRHAIIGMIQKGETQLGRNAETTFAIPIEIIRQVCPLIPAPSIAPNRVPLVEGIHLLPDDSAQRIQNFLKVYLGDKDYPVPFGGRDTALRTLDDWLAGTTPYLLLAAPAGRGKSALLVRWLDGLQARNGVALAFVPVSIRFGTNLEHAFYAALAARLAFLHGDDVPASPETSTAVYRGLVAGYLAQPLPDGRTLLVVLDGLDEAGDWQAGADFLPSDLPARVRVIVSARYLAGDADAIPWLRRLNWERSGLAAAPLLDPLDKVGVADVLVKMGCPLDELGNREKIVATLHYLSEGDPLLVVLYIDKLWKKGEKELLLKLEDLANIRPGYKDYFDGWWRDQEKMWGSETPLLRPHVQLLFNLLACALGGLTRTDLAWLTHLELNRYTLDHALKILQRFIVGDGIKQGYIFSHPKLNQYFWDALSQPEQIQVEKLFLDWGERTLQEFIDGQRNPKKKDEVPGYVVRNYGAHLARAKQPLEKWLPLIHRQEWAQAWFALEGAYGGYAQDVQRVWEVCRALDRETVEKEGNAPYLGEQIRCGLIETSLHSLAGKIPAELIPVLVREGIWTLPQVWVFIRQMPEERQRAEAIIALIPVLEDSQLPEALEAARVTRDEGWRARVLSALAQRLPEIAGEALEATRAILDKGDRARVLSELVQCLPEIADEALEAARAIWNERRRAWALRKLVQHLPDEWLGEALKSVRAIRNEMERIEALSTMMLRLPEVVGEAMEAVRAIQDEEDRAGVLQALVQNLPKERLGEVLGMVEAIQGEKARAIVLIILAQYLPDEVLKMGRTIQDGENRAIVLSVLAHYQSGVIGEALEAARATQDGKTRAWALRVLVDCRPGVIGEALEAARAIQDGKTRAWALSILAHYQPEVAGEVLEAARAIQDWIDRVYILRVLVPGLSEEWLGEALEMVWSIQDEKDRANVLSLLAQHLPKMADQVLVTAQAIHDEKKRAHVLQALVPSLPEKWLGEALEAARAIQDEEERVRLLSALMQRLPEVAGEVMKVALTIQNKETRVRLLVVLMQRLPEEWLGEALEATRTIEDEWDHARVLIELAQRMPEVAGEAMKVGQAIQGERERVSMLIILARRLPKIAGEILELGLTIRDEWWRAEALSGLVQYTPEEQLGEVLEAAQSIQEEGCRGRVLMALSQYMHEELLGEVLEAGRVIQEEGVRVRVLNALSLRMLEAVDEALEAARAIQDEEHRALALSVLVQSKPEIIDEALDAAQAIQDESRRADVLSELARCIPKEQLSEVMKTVWVIQNGKKRAWMLSILAQRMPTEQLGEVLETMRMIPDEENRTAEGVLNALVLRMPKEKLDEVLEAARVIKDVRSRAGVLIELVQRLPEVAGEALEAARTIQNEMELARALSKLAQCIPKEWLSEVLEAARAIRKEGEFVKVLSELIQRMPKEWLGEVMKPVREIQVASDRVWVLKELAQSLPNLPVSKCYSMIEPTLTRLSQRTRADFFSDISALLPVFIHLSREGVDGEIWQAVRDVSVWWK